MAATFSGERGTEGSKGAARARGRTASLNAAAVPVPSAVPAVAEPARVVTVSMEVSGLFGGAMGYGGKGGL
eukprot:4537288-Prymnesium_polylepis.1